MGIYCANTTHAHIYSIHFTSQLVCGCGCVQYVLCVYIVLVFAVRTCEGCLLLFSCDAASWLMSKVPHMRSAAVGGH